MSGPRGLVFFLVVLGGKGGSLMSGPSGVGGFVWVVLGGRRGSYEWSRLLSLLSGPRG